MTKMTNLILYEVVIPSAAEESSLVAQEILRSAAFAQDDAKRHLC